MLTVNAIGDALLHRANVVKELTKLTKTKETIDEALREYMTELGLTKTEEAGYSVTLSPAVRKSLDQYLLLQAGVTTDQLFRGTKSTQYTTLRVRSMEDGKADDQ